MPTESTTQEELLQHSIEKVDAPEIGNQEVDASLNELVTSLSLGKLEKDVKKVVNPKKWVKNLVNRDLDGASLYNIEGNQLKLNIEETIKYLSKYEGIKNWNEFKENISNNNYYTIVLGIQVLLVSLGHKNLKIDGIYGPHTKKAVIAFQKKYNEANSEAPISVDGVIGPETIRAIITEIELRKGNILSDVIDNEENNEVTEEEINEVAEEEINEVAEEEKHDIEDTKTNLVDYISIDDGNITIIKQPIIIGDVEYTEIAEGVSGEGYKFIDGILYIGDFDADGKVNGPTIIVDNDGNISKGETKDGKQIGIWLQVDANHSIMRIDYDNDETIDDLESIKGIIDNANNNQEESLDLNGLTSLDKETASELAKFSGSYLSLNGITSLDRDTARELANFKGSRLVLDGLTSLDKETASELAKFSGEILSLDGLTSLDRDTARELANFKGSRLVLNGLTSLDEGTARELANFSGGELYLNGLTSLDKEIAGELANFNCSYLYLNGLTSLDEGTARELANFSGGELYLNGLTSLDEDAASELANFKGRLYLNGLTSLDEGTAGELAKFSGEILSLDGLTSLDKETAGKLAFHHGNLSLDGLTSLDKETAGKLAFHYGNLYLNGLTSLDKETAGELAFHHGNLYLNGLTSISDEVAENLMPIRSEIEGHYTLLGKINEVEKKIMDRGLKSLQSDVENTKEKKDWRVERGDMKYDLDKGVVSWGKTVPVEYVTKDSIILKGFPFSLEHTEGLWLANFKNWLKKTYGNKKVEFKRDIINKSLSMKKTFVVENKMLISRGDLESHLPMCSDDSVMETISAWLNA